MKLTEQAIQKLMQGGFSNLMDLNTGEFLGGERDPEILKEVYERDVETFELALKIHRVFSSGDGAEVLAYYRKMTLERVQFDPLSANPNETGFFRSGEANVILHMITAMKAAEKGPPKMPSELMTATPEGETV